MFSRSGAVVTRGLCLSTFRTSLNTGTSALTPLRRRVRYCSSRTRASGSNLSALGTPTQGSTEKDIGELSKSLSEEDQKLILSALQNPDMQPSSKMGGPGVGTKNGDMVAVFTCGRCEYRMVKKFSKHAYTKGIVIIQCPSCEVRHLIADNLGWFVDESKNIEDILREKGESFVHLGCDYQVEPAANDG
uniref:WGS project CAEQ00000000 data, annotated contig 1731 n=1 Tax=Trypanosoma congolense (strain IL3000) TaxID=1068625 RepID=F9W8F0_TRYCI|nr:unnamed protein product [Trypanosoma congolense IL3000]